MNMGIGTRLLGLLRGTPYRWESFAMPSMPKSYERRNGRGKSIYRRWGLNDSAYYIDLPKKVRRGMDCKQTRAMRMKLWKERQK